MKIKTPTTHLPRFAPLAAAASLTLGLGSAAAQVTPATYDFSNATAGQQLRTSGDNWSRIGGVGDDEVRNTAQPTGFSGNYLWSNPTFSSRQFVRQNDANFTYSLPATLSNLTLSVNLRADNQDEIAWIGLNEGTGADSFRFGRRNDTNWGFRDRNGDVTELGNPSGDGQLTGTAKNFLVTIEMTFSNPSNPAAGGTLDFIVDDLDTAAAPQAIASNQSFDDFGNPADYDGLFIRVAGASMDNFSIIPEPSTAAVFAGIGVLGLVALRRRRF